MKVEALHPGIELKIKIKGAGFRQLHVAQQIGIKESHLSEILSGKRALSAKICLAFERVFGLNAKEWYYKQADYDLGRAKEPA